jgi:hypothetical protein
MRLKKKKPPKVREFIVVTNKEEVFCGLKKGYPNFSPNWNEAKPLQNPTQLRYIRQGTHHQLEILYLDNG